MKLFILALIAMLAYGNAAWARSLDDCAGVLRVFGDRSSWMSTCFVVGDGSWVVATWDSITEKVGPETDRTIRYPIFIGAFTGQAHQCELKAQNKDLGVALLKLPAKGLPAAPLAQLPEFSKAAYGTLGELMQGEPIGNRWPTEIYGITREKSADGAFKLVVGGWSAAKVFVTDIGKYKWLFLSDVTPEKSVPDGSMVARGSVVVGMYLNRLVITGGKENVIFGRCAMSTEIARYLGTKGVDTTTLYEPPKPTVTRPDGAARAFQLQASIYSFIGAGRPDLALDSATTLVKLLPEDAQARMIYGAALNGTGKFEEAAKAFDEAAKLDSKLPTLRTNRALSLIGLKKISEAEAELLKAVEEAPGDSRPVAAMTEFYLADEKTLDNALTYARKARDMAPDSPAALLLLAKVQKRKNDYQAAVNTIGAAIKMAPDWGEAYYALGATFEGASDKANAEKAYRLLVEKQPKNPDSLLTLASFLADQDKKDEATELIAKVRDLKPPKPVLDAAKALEDKISGKKQEEPKPAGPAAG